VIQVLRATRQAAAAAFLVAATALCAAAPDFGLGFTVSSPLHTLSPAVSAEIEKSMRLARGTVPDGAISSYYNTVRVAKLVDPKLLPNGPDNFAFDREHPAIAPTKMFDQLYYIGSEHVGTFVLVTRAGIVEWDAMTNDKEASGIVEAGYRQLGLDPAKIRYIIITHAHGDHYGGVNYFKRKHPGIRVVASDADWGEMEKLRASPQRGIGGPPPARDIAVKDGETLSVGGTKITFYVTPGHTPGTLSALVPVTDHGVPHLMGLFGGVGVPLGAAELREYADSWTRFGRLAGAAGVDGILSTHPAYDGTLFYITDPSSKKGTANPWVLGRAGTRTYIGAVLEVTSAVSGIVSEARAANK
jgi:metallo-beta-lactamase class B